MYFFFSFETWHIYSQLTLSGCLFKKEKKERNKEKNSKAQALACLMSIVLSVVFALCY
jgi:hypothetical protein